MGAKAVAVLGVMSAATICGFMLGRSTSPDSSNPTTAAVYLAMYGKWKRIDANTGELTLSVGPRLYRYRDDFSKVEVNFISLAQMEGYSMPKRNFEKDLPKFIETAVAPASGGIAATVVATNAKSLGLLTLREKKPRGCWDYPERRARLSAWPSLQSGL